MPSRARAAATKARAAKAATVDQAKAALADLSPATTDNDQSHADADQAPVETAAPSAAATPEVSQADRERGYVAAGEWNGYTRYQCLSCPFDSTREDAIQAHVTTRHPAPKAPRRIVRSTPIVDRFGNALQVEEDAPQEG